MIRTEEHIAQNVVMEDPAVPDRAMVAWSLAILNAVPFLQGGCWSAGKDSPHRNPFRQNHGARQLHHGFGPKTDRPTGRRRGSRIESNGYGQVPGRHACQVPTVAEIDKCPFGTSRRRFRRHTFAEASQTPEFLQKRPVGKQPTQEGLKSFEKKLRVLLPPTNAAIQVGRRSTSPTWVFRGKAPHLAKFLEVTVIDRNGVRQPEKRMVDAFSKVVPKGTL